MDVKSEHLKGINFQKNPCRHVFVAIPANNKLVLIMWNNIQNVILRPDFQFSCSYSKLKNVRK